MVQYDLSVRDGDGSLIQVYYGEDGIDPTKVKYLEKYPFLEQNAKSFSNQYKLSTLKAKLHPEAVSEFLANRENTKDTIMSHYSPGSYLGAVSERVLKSSTEYAQKLKKKKLFTNLANIRYLYSLV